MRHPRDGDLRRLVDEEWAVASSVRRHVEGCTRCGDLVAAMRDDSMAIAGRFSEREPGDAVAARERLRALELRPSPVRRLRRAARPPYWRIAGFSAAAALVLAVAFTPIGSYAKGLLLIFQPKSFTAIPIGPSEFASSLSQLRAFGRLQGVTNLRLSPVADRAAAQTAAGYHVAVAGPGVPSSADAPVFGVLPSHTESLTLSSSKIAAYAAQAHQKMPPLPAAIDGSTISVTTGPAVVSVYGGSLGSLSGASAQLPDLLIAQAPAPKVYSTGATLAEMESYFLSTPGFPPQLAAAIKAIGAPESTLPIPIPIGQALSQTVAVQGVQGVAIGDQTGVGSGVVWQKDGMVYAVVGSLPQSQILQVAQGLK